MKKPKDCVSCKVTSICCLAGIGTYLLYSAKSYQGNTKVLIILLGAGTICLGIGEVFDKSPFRNAEAK